MTTQEFEAKIKEEIDADLNIRVNPNHPDIAGVYLNNLYISVAVSAEELKEEFDPNHKDAFGHPFRTIEQSFEHVLKKYERYTSAEAQALIKETDYEERA